jgi:hypothetical protein
MDDPDARECLTRLRVSVLQALRPWEASMGVALLLLALALGVAAPASAEPIVVTFESLEGQGLVPDGYGGINWGANWVYYDWAQEPYTPHSGKVRVAIADGLRGPTGRHPQFSSNSPNMRFDGAWFAGSDVEFGGVFVQFLLFNDGSLVGNTGALPVTSRPAFLPSGYIGAVDAVEVRSGFLGSPQSTPNAFWVMDDVTYSVAPIPEPTSLVLLGSGALGGAIMRRWWHRKA